MRKKRYMKAISTLEQTLVHVCSTFENPAEIRLHVRLQCPGELHREPGVRGSFSMGSWALEKCWVRHLSIKIVT